MKCISFNNLPLSVITPTFKAYDGDVVLRTKIAWPVLMMLKPPDKLLRKALAAMEQYDGMEARRLVGAVLAQSPAHPDASALAGFFALGRCEYPAAVEMLRQARVLHAAAGMLTRKLCPTLRFLIRISRFQFFPVYPDYYGVSLALAIALGKTGKGDEAVQVLREITSFFGWREEMRIIAGEIALASGDFEAASEHLTTEHIGYRDDLDLTFHILKALADMEIGKHHSAAMILRSDAVYTRDRNRYLTTIAKIIYSHALEEDGLPLLALRESAAIDKQTALSPDVRTYIKWREAKLKVIVDKLKGEALIKAADFSWHVKGSRITEESLEEVIPIDLQRISRPQDAEASTAHERMRRLDAVFREFQTRVEPEDPAKDVPPPPDFNPLAVYDWSVSRAGDDEMCYYDFRGMREAPEGMLEREKHYKHLEETAAAIGIIVLVLWLMVRCY